MNSVAYDSLRPLPNLKVTGASLRNYIYWSTLIGVFSVMLSIKVPFHVRLFDGIMVTNLLLMVPLANTSRLRIPAWVPLFILYLAGSGLIGIVTGTDTLPQVAKELLGISTSVLYYYCFFKMIGNDFERAFSTYAKIAYWFAIIALPLWLANCLYYHTYLRLQGLTTEPTTFCQLVLPAYYWYAYRYFTSRKHGREVAVFTLAMILTDSANGYICVAFGIMLLLSKRLKYILLVPLVIGGLATLAYVASPNVRKRVDDTVLVVSTQDVSKSNISTFALMSNVFVARQVLRASPVIGNGLGSHPISHALYIESVPGVETFLQARMAGLNADDASALSIRVLSELGILGFAGMMVFLYHFHVGGRGPLAAMSNAVLVHFFLKLFRGPTYFEPELFFFIFVYILSYRQFRFEARSRIRHRGSEPLRVNASFNNSGD